MTRFLLYTAMMAAAIALALIAVRIGGGLLKSPAVALLDTARCDQPCWRGIRPGQTPIDQAEMAFVGDSQISLESSIAHFDNERCWNTDSSEQARPWEICAVYLYRGTKNIRLLRVNPPQGTLTLGDALAIYGAPVAIKLCGWNTDVPNMPGNFVRARVSFKGNIEVWAYDFKQPQSLRLNPYMLVYTLRYQIQMESTAYERGDVHWPGFTLIDIRNLC